MRDHEAHNLAREAHEGIIQASGGLRPDERLCYRTPLPPAPRGWMEGVIVDDHLGVQRAPRAGWRHWARTAPARDQEVFDAVNASNVEVNLSAHPKKAVRRAPVLVAWGAQVERDAGWTGAPRSKLTRLAHVTVMVAMLRVVTEEVLQSLLGVWAFVLSFRCPLFAFLLILFVRCFLLTLSLTLSLSCSCSLSV
jgi:hypothetical protein